MKRKLQILLAIVGTIVSAHGQITITSKDIFREIGEYARAYASTNEVSVAGKLGTAGGPQHWDFSSGPTNLLQLDYVAVSDGNTPIPGATLAERRINPADNSKSWLYIAQTPGIGRQLFGFYNPKLSSNSVPFVNPIVDFPETIKFGDAWKSETQYDVRMILNQDEPNQPIGLSLRIISKRTSKADAFGTLAQPGLNSGEALRVNELTEQEIQMDFEDNGIFVRVATEYQRTFYWLRSRFGIVAEIRSKSNPIQAPSDTFATASEFIRVFEMNRARSISAEELRTVEQTQAIRPTYGDCPEKLPGKDGLIVVTHGWLNRLLSPFSPPDSPWLDSITNEITSYLRKSGANNWQVCAYRWIEKAWVASPTTAIRNSRDEGVILGDCLLMNKWENVHLIAYSAGAPLIQTASDVIKSSLSSEVKIHLTFLDPFMGLNNEWRTTYGKRADWSDYYFAHDLETSGEIFSATEGYIEGAYNVDVTGLDDNINLVQIFYSAVAGIAGATCGTIVSSHHWPVDFYKRTIREPEWSDARGFGFPLSQEAGGWKKALNQYPPGNKSPMLLGKSDIPCVPLPNETTPMFANPTFEWGNDTSLIQSSTGIKELIGTGMHLTTASPAWVAKPIEITNVINFLSFEASFTSEKRAESLLSIYWGTNVIGLLDERVTLPGLQKHSFPIPETATNGIRMLGFRLDPFSDARSSVTITNVAIGFRGLRESFSLSLTGTLTNGTPILQLRGPQGYTYTVQSSSNLVDWTTTALLANMNGSVQFTDSLTTNTPARFYRATTP
ncbi:MAG: hypothetical protein FJY98_01160 [Candidatus Liptonbacteria bacterium]|nr:hypothetical protein [Candidatus Liptonbacteria bacterium]